MMKKLKKFNLIFFSGFDSLIQKIQNFGLVNENLHQNIPDFYLKRYVSSNKITELKYFLQKTSQ